MKHILKYIVCILLLFATSCIVHETDVVDDPVVGDTVRMNIAPLALNSSVPVRIIVTNATTGKVAVNQYPAIADPATGDFSVKLKTGRYNFYILGNEPARLTPALNNIDNHNQLYGLDIYTAELPLDEIPQYSNESSNIPILGMTTAIVRPSSADAKKAEASTDDGQTWDNALSIKLDRLAVKVLLALGKNTPNASDKVIIKKIEITNIPAYGYILGKPYDGFEYSTVNAWSDDTGFEIVQGEYPVALVSDFILPEYILLNSTQMDVATTMKITATYNQRTVQYFIPIKGNSSIVDYSLSRNTYCVIVATITTDGYYTYLPEVNYRIEEWIDAVDNPNFPKESAIQYSAHWADGTLVDAPARTVYVANDETLEYRFILNYPANATWAATITNPIDFTFDYSDGAVSSGRAKQGQEYIIRIKPRREVFENDPKTDFFITVNNGLGNVELNLPDSQVGTGNRYTIIQTPN